MENQPIAIVLGGTDPHITLIENLKERGYHTVLIDYYENPVAKKAADEHIKESTLDQEKVLDITLKLDAKLVISTCVDQANLTACYVAEKLSLPAPYSYTTALSVTNKGLMKKKMIENGIPTSKYIYIDNTTEINDFDLRLPVVVKPADCCGCRGVRKANSLLELNKYLADVLDISRINKAIVEEFKEGVEIVFDCFVENKKVHIINIRQIFPIIISGEPLLNILATMVTAEISQKAKKNTQQIANKIADVFGLDNTPLLLETIVNGDDVNIIEFAPRADGALSYRIVKLSTDFDILDAAINSYLGIKTNFKYKQPELCYLANHIYTLPGIFGCITGYEELIRQNIIEEFFTLKTKGMEIGSDTSSHNRVGSFIVKSCNRQELFRKLSEAIDKLEVYDIYGNPITRKELYQELRYEDINTGIFPKN